MATCPASSATADADLWKEISVGLIDSVAADSEAGRRGESVGDGGVLSCYDRQNGVAAAELSLGIKGERAACALPALHSPSPAPSHLVRFQVRPSRREPPACAHPQPPADPRPPCAPLTVASALPLCSVSGSQVNLSQML